MGLAAMVPRAPCPPCPWTAQRGVPALWSTGLIGLGWGGVNSPPAPTLPQVQGSGLPGCCTLSHSDGFPLATGHRESAPRSVGVSTAACFPELGSQWHF